MPGFIFYRQGVQLFKHITDVYVKLAYWFRSFIVFVTLHFTDQFLYFLSGRYRISPWLLSILLSPQGSCSWNPWPRGVFHGNPYTVPFLPWTFSEKRGLRCPQEHELSAVTGSGYHFTQAGERMVLSRTMCLPANPNTWWLSASLRMDTASEIREKSAASNVAWYPGDLGGVGERVT